MPDDFKLVKMLVDSVIARSGSNPMFTIGYLEAHMVSMLRLIKKESPETYAKLSDEIRTYSKIQKDFNPNG
jgi:hypothetical protein